MTFQTYIDNMCTKTGKTPKDFLEAAKAKDMVGPNVKAMETANWLKSEYGHGHALAIVLTIKNAGAR